MPTSGFCSPPATRLPSFFNRQGVIDSHVGAGYTAAFFACLQLFRPTFAFASFPDQSAMQFVIKLFPEVSLKSQSIQRRFTMTLQGNICNILHRFDADARIERQWDKLIITSPHDEHRARYLDELARIPGIQYILEVAVSTLNPDEDMRAQVLAHTLAVWGAQLAGKTFCVRVKRVGQHDFTSLELQKHVGAGVAMACPHGGVRLNDPDVLIQLELQQQTLYIVRATHAGLGGYPLGTQEEVLSLLSGGFDSALASMQFIKRGSRVHYCFFNLGGAAHLRGVQQMAAILWHRFGSTHRVHFIAVDFAHVLADIVEHIPLGNQGVVLKRAMLQVADQLAQRMNVPALITGEALGQVASQTLSNLNVIDRASHTVVLRPLISWDKPDIIAQARKIGVAELAERIPEYCGAISNNPNIKASLRQVEKDELHLDAGLLQHALEQAQWFDVRDLALPGSDDLMPAGVQCATGTPRRNRRAKLATPAAAPLPGLAPTTAAFASRTTEAVPATNSPPARPVRTMENASSARAPVRRGGKKSGTGTDHVALQAGDVVIDVRAPDEARAKPLRLAQTPVQCIPFYKIASTFAELDPAKRYLLYCARGVMSQLQVAHLRERGFENVAVYRQVA